MIRFVPVFLLAFVSLASAASPDRSPVHFVIAVGTVAPETATGMIDEAVQALRPGDSLSVMTLENQQLVGRIVLPGNRRINDRARELRYGEQRDAIKAVLSARGTSVSAAATRWPQGLAELGKLIEPGNPDRNIHILLLDAALYNDATEPRLSMKSGYPNGALIAGSQTLSPFGTADRKERLRGVAVHFCHREEPKDFVNDLHQQRVEDAVAQFVTQQGGGLSTFTNAIRICAARFLTANQTGSLTPPPINASEAPAMVQVKLRSTALDPAVTKSIDIAGNKSAVATRSPFEAPIRIRSKAMPILSSDRLVAETTRNCKTHVIPVRARRAYARISHPKRATKRVAKNVVRPRPTKTIVAPQPCILETSTVVIRNGHRPSLKESVIL